MKWCASCAKVGQTSQGEKFISMPSPGRMYEMDEDDPLAAWQDCYETKPKRRILVKQAKTEIWRAWELWDGDRTNSESMFIFFGWLQRHRPYFLTFRNKGDPWQKVHSWLVQHEE